MQKQAQTKKQPRTFKELNILLDKIGEKLDKNAEQIGGIGNNLGDVAEEYFYTGLQSRKTLNGVKYDFVNRNNRRRKDLEWDILLENGNSVAVLEVKHKLHPKDVENFATRKLPMFRESLPEFVDYQVYGGVAGMAVPEDSRKMAEEYGLTVLTQNGKNLKVLNSKGFKPKAF